MQPTLSLYEDPEQWMSCRHCLAEVVIIVDRQQITVDVGIADHHLHVGDAVNVQNELVKLLKLAGLDPVHREPAKFCPILQGKEDQKREAIKRDSYWDRQTGRGNRDVRPNALI